MPPSILFMMMCVNHSNDSALLFIHESYWTQPDTNHQYGHFIANTSFQKNIDFYLSSLTGSGIEKRPFILIPPKDTARISLTNNLSAFHHDTIKDYKKYLTRVAEQAEFKYLPNIAQIKLHEKASDYYIVDTTKVRRYNKFKYIYGYYQKEE